MLDGVALEGELRHQGRELESGGAHPGMLTRHTSRPFVDTPLILESQVGAAQKMREAE